MLNLATIHILIIWFLFLNVWFCKWHRSSLFWHYFDSFGLIHRHKLLLQFFFNLRFWLNWVCFSFGGFANLFWSIATYFALPFFWFTLIDWFNTWFFSLDSHHCDKLRQINFLIIGNQSFYSPKWSIIILISVREYVFQN